MFKRILLPIDPSRPFGGANQYAVDLAHRFTSHIAAAYVIDEQLVGHMGGEASTTLDEALEWVGRDAIDDFIANHLDISVSKEMAYGSTPTALFQLVLQTGADLVVVGGYHGTAAGHVWGSTVADVVHHVERPTFVVRKGGRIPREGDRIVVPFDGSERAISNLPRTAAFAKAMGAGIELVNVAKPRDSKNAQRILQKGMHIVAESGVEATNTILRRSFVRAKWRIMLQHARAINSPLIAISRLGLTSQRTGRSRTVDHLVAHADIPVWVVRK